MHAVAVVVAAAVAAASTLVHASPAAPVVVLDKKLPGVRYMDHVVFAPGAVSAALPEAAAGHLDRRATCAHSICTTGTKLAKGCDPCADKIIAADSFCGSTSWDSICVGEVASVCGLSCSSTTTSVKPPPTSTTTTTSATATTTGKPPQKAGLLKYYGGPVISNVEVTMLLWGAANFASDLEGFYAGVTDSTYFDMLAQYWTPTQSIGRGKFIKSISLTGLPSGTSIDDSNIQSYLRGLVSAGTITPNANSYYPIHFAPGYSITQGGQGSCQVFCAYHGTIDISDISVAKTKYLFYGVMPDQGGSCAGGCGSAATLFQNLCSVSSHELVEATTDAAVGLATVVGSPLAWYNTAQGEIGDICNAQQGTVLGGNGITYTVQKEYSNNAAACVLA
ncbi:hypothetical protein DFJ73DRAFT_778907 [Zopfochytrium polystomum]|nr:hypothetical protein DFJ73DRAFT_778907 [Zopfochytrium polystomum]